MTAWGESGFPATFLGALSSAAVIAAAPLGHGGVFPYPNNLPTFLFKEMAVLLVALDIFLELQVPICRVGFR